MREIPGALFHSRKMSQLWPSWSFFARKEKLWRLEIKTIRSTTSSLSFIHRCYVKLENIVKCQFFSSARSFKSRNLSFNVNLRTAEKFFSFCNLNLHSFIGSLFLRVVWKFKKFFQLPSFSSLNCSRESCCGIRSRWGKKSFLVN